MTAERLAELMTKGFKAMTGPLVTRLKVVEERTEKLAALEARVQALEQRSGSDGGGA